MKLLIINSVPLPLPPVKGGAVEYLVDAFLLDNEKKHAHDITVYSIYDEKAHEEGKKYKYTTFQYIKIETAFDKIDRMVRHIINRFTKLYIGNTYISKIIKREKKLNQYDVIIIENAPEYALKVRKSFKNKLVLHLHNDRFNRTTKNAEKIFALYDEVYTISNTLGESVQTIKKSDKVKTLYNGIDINRFSYEADKRAQTRKKYNIADDDFVFMYCGRIVPEKGVYELISAFSKLKNEKLKLLVVGGTGYSQEDETDYVKKIKQIRDDRIVFTGFVPYSEIQELYTVPDVGVVPSICQDAFNLTVIEFCANGVPLIISDRGAMKELVNDKCSVIAKCNDDFEDNLYKCLKLLSDNTEATAAMKDEALRVSKKFSIDRYCDRFNTLLANIHEVNEDG